MYIIIYININFENINNRGVNMDEKQYVSLDEYNELLEKYNCVYDELWGIKNRKYYRAINKLGRIAVKLHLDKVMHFINRCFSHFFKIIGMPKICFNNLFVNKVNKLKFPEYKYYKFKKNRVSNYYIDSSKIKHSYTKDLVSIVMPVYNGEKLIDQTIESILNQTYDNFELIIVNDGSTDNTLKIINKYAKKDKRIKVIDQNNQKLPQSIANGFKEASGEYSMWVGADDILHENCVLLLHNDLVNNPKTDFVFPNVRLIDEKGDIISSNRWYATNLEHPEYVMLPKNMLEFCTVKNNYIAPIAMYKSIVVKTLSPFSKNRFTVEDYDYWMRVNDLFMINHTTFDEPIFDYRRHKGSLTSHAKNLNISYNTDLLMQYEDFRQDYYLMPLIWIIDDKEKYPDLVNEIEKRNHIIIDVKQANSCVINDTYSNMIYIDFNSDDSIKKVPNSAYKVKICDKQFKGQNYNLYITSNLDEPIEKIDNQKGWFGITDYSTIFSFIDTKAKEYFLRKIEDVVMDDREEELPLSAIICTYKRTDKLVNVLDSLLKQSEDRTNFEILVVNNDINNKELLELVNDIKKKNKLPDNFLRYVEAPIKGLSYGRNVGMFEARGNILLYLDDDSIALEDNVKEIINAYKNNESASVVGGNIILKKPSPTPEVLIDGKEGFWSQYLIEGTNDKIVNEWYQFPYGANYSVKKKDLLKIGGFRVTYGRQGHNFLGGEEVVVSSLIQKLGKNVVIAPKAIVYHDVDPSRYTYEHVEKTTLSGSMTRVKMEQDLIIRPDFHNIDISKREIRYFKKQYRKSNNDVEKFYIREQIKSNKKALEQIRHSITERMRATKYRKNNLNFIEKR